jgi:uncharacterized protein YjgD (DUF1641 family)
MHLFNEGVIKMEKFTVVGTTMYKGATKVRFANDMATRVKTLVKNGHEAIELFELPKPMTKPEAVAFLATQTLSKEAAEAVANKASEYAPKTPKAAKSAAKTVAKAVAKKVAKPVAKKAAAKAPVKKPTQSIAAKAKAAKAATPAAEVIATPVVTPTTEDVATA